MSTIDILPIFGLFILAFTGFVIAKVKLSKIKKRVIYIVLIVSGFGMIFSYFWIFAPIYRNAYYINEITFFKGPKGNVLLVQHNTIIPSKHAVSYSRLSVIDAETVKIMHTVLAGSSMKDHRKLFLKVITDNKIWYTSYNLGLHSRDPYTGKILMTEKDIIKKYPQLNGSTKVQVKTDDGYVFESKPPGFKLTMISIPPNKLNSGESGSIEYDEEADHYAYNNLNPEEQQQLLYNLDSSYFSLTWDLRVAVLDKKNGFRFENNDPDDPDIMQLMHATYDAAYSGHKVDTCINKELNLRKPFIIRNYLLTNPKSLLVGHYEYGTKRQIQFLMSRIDLKGNIMWTLSQDQLGGEPNIFSFHYGILYIGIKGKLVAIDSKKGIKKWTIQL